MSNGWISIHRKLQNHWLWDSKKVFSNLEAWIDILMEVNHSNKKVLIGSVLFEVNRGDSIKSLDSWAKRWNWNKSKVRRFFILLEKDNMIVTKNERKTTRLTVCNYGSYQDSRNDNETILKQERNASETQLTPNNNDNIINNVLYTESEFLERWRDAREHYDKKPTNIKKLSTFEKVNFDNINKLYTPKEIDNAIAGLFQQKTFPATRLRPTHFLELEHFEKYLTCWTTKEKLYDTKFKKPVERI